MTEVDREALRRYIADRAPVWEVEFDAGPGMVVSLADAAHVAAQFVAEEREKARVPFLAWLGELDQVLDILRRAKASEDKPYRRVELDEQIRDTEATANRIRHAAEEG